MDSNRRHNFLPNFFFKLKALRWRGVEEKERRSEICALLPARFDPCAFLDKNGVYEHGSLIWRIALHTFTGIVFRMDILITKMMLDHVKDFKWRNVRRHRETILITLCDGFAAKRSELVRYFLSTYPSALATLDWQDDMGFTALHHAAATALHSTAVVCALLRFDANAGLRNNRDAIARNVLKPNMSSVCRASLYAILENAGNAYNILPRSGWRPRLQRRLPRPYRDATVTLVILAKCHRVRFHQESTRTYFEDRIEVVRRTTLERNVRYPQTCLELLPEELLQYLFVWITSVPVPPCWLS
jgi:hypothetical protein